MAENEQLKFEFVKPVSGPYRLVVRETTYVIKNPCNRTMCYIPRPSAGIMVFMSDEEKAWRNKQRDKRDLEQREVAELILTKLNRGE